MASRASSARVTVSIPTYNRARLLHRALSSVLEQSFADVEIYISDNASTDDTSEVVASFGDPRVHYAPNAKNIGVHGNLSRGLVLGTAPFLTVLPDDDIMLPGSLERKVRILEEHPEVGVVHSASQLVHYGPDDRVLHVDLSRTGGSKDVIEPARIVLRRLLMGSYWINFPAALIRRSVVGGVRFEEADGLADDLGVFLRLVSHVEAVAYVAEPLIAIRMHSEAHSTQTGFHEFQEGAFRPDFVAIASIKATWERFLKQNGRQVTGVREIRTVSRQWLRLMLMRVARRKANRFQGIRGRWRLLETAARIEPTVLVTPAAFRFLLAGRE